MQVSHSGITPTSAEVPDFPVLRVDSDRLVYQEALINGQYLGAHLSAMGRPKQRLEIWQDLQGGATSDRPLRTRQHAFMLEIDGQLLTDRWEWTGSHTDGVHTVVALRHQQRPVAVDVHTSCDGTSFFTRHLVITNTGDRPCAIAKVAPWSGLAWSAGDKGVLAPEHFSSADVELQALPHSAFTLGRMTDSSWANEGAFDWVPLPAGRSGIESMRGHSGFGAPSCFLRNEATGELLAIDLAWSGNWSITLFNDFEPARRPRCDARAYVEVALAGPAPLRVLEPGESAETPKVHVGALFGDLDAAIQARHRHIRTSVAPPQPQGAQHLVELNTWAAAQGQITEEQLYAEIDLAAELGAELFMLDANWFGNAASDWIDGLGDWNQESPLLTKGVRAALDRARENGLRAGLWVEPERVGSNSKLLADKPEWFMHRRGQVIPNLDLSQPQVAEYFENTITEIIDRYQLDCFRIDYNLRVGEGGEIDRDGYTENILWRYYDALYKVFDTIRERYPKLLLENCSSGGGRTDLGIMSRFHWTQVTDHFAPAPTARILNGATITLPPELCQPYPGRGAQGVSDIDFLIRVRLFGHFNFGASFPAVQDRNPATWERWRHGIELYKDFCRPLLPTSRMFHHTPIQRQTEPGEWIVWECADPTGDRAYAGIFRLQAAEGDSYHFRPRGLRTDRAYRIRYDTAGWDRELDGGALIDNGIRVPVASALTSELLLIEAV
ncbi:alpha-galactosidase [Kribbella solani]|uniref:alpha-galactosidase n=1 Tax=Kribbella solani TaxID=236067 RepID=UPI00308050ED